METLLWMMPIFLHNLWTCTGDVRVKRSPTPFYGIPVPGRTVSPLDILQLYRNSCKPRSRSSGEYNSLSNVENLLSNRNAENLAEHAHSALYFAMGDSDVHRLMGKWFTVIDSPSVHLEQCVVYYYELLHSAKYTATFTVKSYFRSGEDVEMMEGYGTKVGPDPGELMITTGHPSDPCPYTPVKLGPLDKEGQYSYVILSQFLKHPTMVLARDPLQFERKFRAEVDNFLDTYKFRDPKGGPDALLRLADYKQCTQNGGKDYFYDLI